MSNRGQLTNANFESLQVKPKNNGQGQLLILRLSMFKSYDKQNQKAEYEYYTLFTDRDYLIQRIMTLGLPMGQPGGNQQQQQKIKMVVDYKNLQTDMYQGTNRQTGQQEWRCSMKGDIDGDPIIIAAIAKSPQNNNQGGGNPGGFQQSNPQPQNFPQGQPQGWAQPAPQSQQQHVNPNNPAAAQQNWNQQTPPGYAQAPVNDPYQL